jgi:light-regulated signal transduction histidine kinase (bacteriophytochrome)
VAALVLRVRWLLDGEKKLNDELRLALDRLKRTEQEREQRTLELARSNRDLEQFAYVASHDMQEPLRAITQFLQLLRTSYQGRLDKNADDYIHFAVDGAARLQALIRDLLAYARIDSEKKAFAPTDCEKVLDEALANVGARIEETGATITRDPLPTIEADSTQLVQVFQNLIWNAMKFRGPDTPQIHIGCRQEANEWVFWVRDNGIGIAPEFAERVFQIFKRLDTREEYSGTGIGLAVCKRVIERHEGRIWVESQLGQGATFYFKIPA